MLAAAHILAAAGVLCILWATRYPMLIQELCSADAAKTYEESNAFANAVANANYHILDEIQYQTLYDTDGKYDPEIQAGERVKTRPDCPSGWGTCIPGAN